MKHLSKVDSPEDILSMRTLNMYFGDGDDGDFTTSGTNTLTRSQYYKTLLGDVPLKSELKS